MGFFDNVPVLAGVEDAAGTAATAAVDVPADVVNAAGAKAGLTEGQDTGLAGWAVGGSIDKTVDVANPIPEAKGIFGDITGINLAGSVERQVDAEPGGGFADEASDYALAIPGVENQFDEEPGGGFGDQAGGVVANVASGASNAAGGFALGAIRGFLTSPVGLALIGLAAVFVLGDDVLRSGGDR